MIGNLVLWAKAMGAKVVAMSHNEKKRDVALELGADEYVATSDSEALAKYKSQFSHILCTGTGQDFQCKYNWHVYSKGRDCSNYNKNIGETYAPLFRPNGIFINVGLPEWNFPEIRPMLLSMGQVTICGSAIGSPAEIEEMLEFAGKTGVRPWLQTYPMSEAPKAVEDFKAGKPRFRFVLKN